MSKFQKLYEEIFKPADDKEKEQRSKDWIQKWINEHIKDNTLKLNPDGSYDYVGSIDWGNRRLKEIPLKFHKVSGSFFIHENNLTSLKNAPKEVGMHFACSQNNLKTLKGCPTIVYGELDINNNQLTSLKYAPKKVGATLWCNHNKLQSLQGIPKEIDGNFYALYQNSSKHFTKEDVQKVCNVKGKIYV